VEIYLEEEHIQKKAAYRKNKKACQWGWFYHSSRTACYRNCSFL